VSLFIQSKRHIAGAIKDLVAAGLWVPVEGGYQIHDYGDYQPLAAQVKAEREATRNRVKRWRERSSNDVTQSVTDPVTNGARDALRAGARAAAGLGSGSGSGSEGGDAGRIEAEIRRHDVFAALDARAIADAHAGRLMTSSQRVEWVLASVEECAAKHAGLGLNAPTLQGRLVGFMRHAKPPKAPPPEPRKYVESDEEPPTDEELEANRKRMEAREAKAQAERERRNQIQGAHR
jgi:hypothetical protein